MSRHELSIREIIRAAGGVRAISDEAGLTIHAVDKWGRCGVPDRHWAILIRRARVTADQIFRANEALRAKGEAA